MTRLSLAGKSTEVTHEDVGIETLHLNPENPRIRFLLDRTKGKKDQASLMALIRAQPGYDNIHKSIRKADGLHDPIIISHDGLVVEGNTRTTAVKALHEGAKQDKRWLTVPVMRLPRNVDERGMGLLMTAYHIGGKNNWRAFAQAEHIHTLVTRYNVPLSTIADEARMNEGKVQQYLDAFKFLVDEVLPEADESKVTEILEKKWSHALEFVKGKANAPHRSNKSTRKEVAKLIATTRIKGVEVRNIGAILSNPKAKTELKKSGLAGAKKVMAAHDPVADSRILRDVQALTVALEDLGGEDLDVLLKHAAARKVVRELKDAVETVLAVAGTGRSGKNGKA
ncbi:MULTISPECIES: hypothetical protein [unclassified Bradyrhizobium]|uniref:hypothetical protein n=1 Tax=unclassified Bradyrhizobium TaxID=2631580 RepID=UPI001FF8C5C1|nr:MULTISPECIES: hypothetical protein [unclassified Bradyrhizobium]MCK1539816.1 hypothetical protein [Bradyrhizobium sp. 176]MCK1561618.1 hypothetical protein [Bradyrhizobium sp. 171]MCK1698221.1 hypothetical protein [Bradyrhizobium sp. 144]